MIYVDGTYVHFCKDMKGESLSSGIEILNWFWMRNIRRYVDNKTYTIQKIYEITILFLHGEQEKIVVAVESRGSLASITYDLPYKLRNIIFVYTKYKYNRK